jgi:integrase
MSNRSKSRRRGTITLRKDQKDAWLVRVTLGRDLLTGKRQRINQTVRGTRTDAQRVLTELLGKQDRGVALPRSTMTLGEWLDEYGRVWSGGLGPQTRDNAAQALRCYISPALRAVRLQSLRAGQFQTLYNEMVERELAPATISNFHRILRTRLGKAVELGHLARHPLAGAVPPAGRRREYRVLSPAEARIFLEEVECDTLPALWTLLLMTGIRPAEALGLKWEDLEGNRLAVRRALVRTAKGAWELAETKTRRARTVTLPGAVVKALTRHRARQSQARLVLGGQYASHGLIFAATFGQPLHWANVAARHFDPILTRTALRVAGLTLPEALTRGAGRAKRDAWAKERAKVEEKALNSTGLARMRPYDLRHSAATLLLAAGEHPKVVAELLGHSKITLTLDTYSHVVPGMLDQAAERMERIVTNPGQLAASGS